eukprot:1159404-Pelagomonas_calceolata.AAC.8
MPEDLKFISIQVVFFRREDIAYKQKAALEHAREGRQAPSENDCRQAQNVYRRLPDTLDDICALVTSTILHSQERTALLRGCSQTRAAYLLFGCGVFWQKQLWTIYKLVGDDVKVESDTNKSWPQQILEDVQQLQDLSPPGTLPLGCLLLNDKFQNAGSSNKPATHAQADHKKWCYDDHSA